MKRKILAGLVALAATAANADYKVQMNAIDAKGVGKSLGTVTVSDAGPGGGVKLLPDLKGLPPGLHGFHLHEFANCAAKEKDGKLAAGEAAGGHWDPDKAGKHAGPQGGGHRGDLPALVVSGDGTAKKGLIAPKLKLADFANKALVVHAGGDNNKDEPQPNGGGGERIACGTVETGKKG